MPSSTEPPASSPRVAIVAGSTGLIGRALVGRLAQGIVYDRVLALVRRKGDMAAAGVAVPVVVAYEHLEHARLPFAGADVYCCLGTTMARAGSRAAFRRVDVTYVVRLAALAQAGGAQGFGLVSSLGADVDSLFFYSRCKGEAEKGVASLGLPSVTIARPSLLVGERAEARRGERIAEAVLGPLDGFLASRAAGPLARLRPISGADVAAALAAVVPQHLPGVRTYDPDALRTAARTSLPLLPPVSTAATADDARTPVLPAFLPLETAPPSASSRADADAPGGDATAVGAPTPEGSVRPSPEVPGSGDRGGGGGGDDDATGVSPLPAADEPSVPGA